MSLYQFESTTGQKGTVSEQDLKATIARLQQGESMLIGHASDAETQSLVDSVSARNPRMANFFKRQLQQQ